MKAQKNYTDKYKVIEMYKERTLKKTLLEKCARIAKKLIASESIERLIVSKTNNSSCEIIAFELNGKITKIIV